MTGKMFFFLQVCRTCQKPARKSWHSTYKEGQLCELDTVFVAAINLSGCSIAGVRKLMAFANIGTISNSAYHRLASTVVHPVIQEAYDRTMDANRAAAAEASPTGLIVAGTCLFPSPSVVGIDSGPLGRGRRTVSGRDVLLGCKNDVFCRARCRSNVWWP